MEDLLCTLERTWCSVGHLPVALHARNKPLLNDDTEKCRISLEPSSSLQRQRTGPIESQNTEPPRLVKLALGVLPCISSLLLFSFLCCILRPDFFTFRNSQQLFCIWKDKLNIFALHGTGETAQCENTGNVYVFSSHFIWKYTCDGVLPLNTYFLHPMVNSDSIPPIVCWLVPEFLKFYLHRKIPWWKLWGKRSALPRAMRQIS